VREGGSHAPHYRFVGAAAPEQDPRDATHAEAS
jgi:hypothetical protein